jgi:hypothetical protein
VCDVDEGNTDSWLRMRRLAGLKRVGDSKALFLLGGFVGRLGLAGKNRSKGKSFNGPGRRISFVEQIGFVYISWRAVVVVVVWGKRWGKNHKTPSIKKRGGRVALSNCHAHVIRVCDSFILGLSTLRQSTTTAT